MKFVALLFVLVGFTQLSFAQVDNRELLIKQLDSIGIIDQLYRGQLETTRAKFAADSSSQGVELRKLFKLMKQTDSLNLITVTSIINEYGWLSTEEIGESANATLFMVIQHADLKTQEKYLPIMRIAAKNKKLKATTLALLEDRIAMLQGRKQIYGSQVAWNLKTNKYTIMPMLDPDHVDVRRAEIGLGPYSAYLSDMNIVWDVEQYKKELPSIELWHKEMMSKVKKF